MEKIFTIKSNIVFSRLYSKGKSSAQPTVVVYCRRNPSLNKACVGITASKKMGGAVERNRARRLIREAYRRIMLEGSSINDNPYYFVIVARGKCFNPKTRMQDVYADIKRAMNDLGITL